MKILIPLKAYSSTLVSNKVFEASLLIQLSS